MTSQYKVCTGWFCNRRHIRFLSQSTVQPVSADMRIRNHRKSNPRGGASKFLAMFFNVLGRRRRRRAQLATGSADENRSNVCCIPMKMPAQRIVARKCARRTAEAFASDTVRLVALLQSADPGQRRADDRKGGRDPGQRQRYPHEDARAACCRSAVCATHSCDPVCSCARKSGRV